jgi:hypothetical protein
MVGLCAFLVQHYLMKMYGRTDVEIHIFQTLERWRRVASHTSVALNLGKLSNDPLDWRMDVAGLIALDRRISSFHCL